MLRDFVISRQPFWMTPTYSCDRDPLLSRETWKENVYLCSQHHVCMKSNWRLSNPPKVSSTVFEIGRSDTNYSDTVKCNGSSLTSLFVPLGFSVSGHDIVISSHVIIIVAVVGRVGFAGTEEETWKHSKRSSRIWWNLAGEQKSESSFIILCGIWRTLWKTIFTGGLLEWPSSMHTQPDIISIIVSPWYIVELCENMI